MNLYVASAFKFKEDIETVVEHLEAHGYAVPDKWWNVDYKKLDLPDFLWYKDPRVKDAAKTHWSSIRDCDALVLVADHVHQRPHAFTGANVELGFALGLGKPCFSLGALERSAMYTPVVKYERLDDLLDGLDILRSLARGTLLAYTEEAF